MTHEEHMQQVDIQTGDLDPAWYETDSIEVAIQCETWFVAACQVIDESEGTDFFINIGHDFCDKPIHIKESITAELIKKYALCELPAGVTVQMISDRFVESYMTY